MSEELTPEVLVELHRIQKGLTRINEGRPDVQDDDRDSSLTSISQSLLWLTTHDPQPSLVGEEREKLKIVRSLNEQLSNTHIPHDTQIDEINPNKDISLLIHAVSHLANLQPLEPVIEAVGEWEDVRRPLPTLEFADEISFEPVVWTDRHSENEGAFRIRLDESGMAIDVTSGVAAEVTVWLESSSSRELTNRLNSEEEEQRLKSLKQLDSKIYSARQSMQGRVTQLFTELSDLISDEAGKPDCLEISLQRVSMMNEQVHPSVSEGDTRMTGKEVVDRVDENELERLEGLLRDDSELYPNNDSEFHDIDADLIREPMENELRRIDDELLPLRNYAERKAYVPKDNSDLFLVDDDDFPLRRIEGDLVSLKDLLDDSEIPDSVSLRDNQDLPIPPIKQEGSDTEPASAASDDEPTSYIETYRLEPILRDLDTLPTEYRGDAAGLSASNISGSSWTEPKKTEKPRSIFKRWWDRLWKR